MTLIASCTNREQESQSKEVTMLIVTRDSLETVFA
jgi:hypothetical protein